MVMRTPTGPARGKENRPTPLKRNKTAAGSRYTKAASRRPGDVLGRVIREHPTRGSDWIGAGFKVPPRRRFGAQLDVPLKHSPVGFLPRDGGGVLVLKHEAHETSDRIGRNGPVDIDRSH